MKKLIALTVVAISMASTAANIVLIGDSTLAPRDAKTKLGSWGDALKPSLAPGHGIINRSVGGRTVRTTKPSWAKSLEMISKGDFVIIQFGINDANKKKLVEEAAESWTAAEYEGDARTAEELSQLLYHVQTMMLAKGLSLEDVYRYL